jgi:crotonobetainyl-CoA:carnitine CoA-transferase CaiB-like acyl-CoA transferase
MLGEHSDTVLAELCGVTTDELQRLRETGVV